MKRLLSYLRKRLAISIAVRLNSVLWIAEAILLALGVIKEVKTQGIELFVGIVEPYKYVTSYLQWLHWVQRKELNDIWPDIVRYTGLGMSVLIRAP